MQQIELNKQQEQAIYNATEKAFTIVTGGAGTGKSTLINMMRHKLDNSIVVAPTGKASARLKDDGIESSTIHSMLGFNGAKFMSGKLSNSSIIIDESSMIDSELLNEIVKREPKKLVLIGDDAQLYPVGSGSPFHDAINIRPDIVTNLTQCYRNKEAIFHNALKIRNGESPATKEQTEDEFWSVQETGDIDNTVEHVINIISRGKLDFNQDVILCTRNKDVDKFNEEISYLLFPERGEAKFIVGDRVMCCKNFAPKDVWNGTTGTITGIDQAGKMYVKKDLDGTEVLFDKAMINETKLAYAMTVHKSQGSQYRKVIFCCFSADAFVMLSRSMIYTAVTRAKNACLVIGNNKAFFESINKTKTRQTVMKELNKNAIKNKV